MEEQGIQEGLKAEEARGHHKYGPSALDALAQCVRFKYREIEGDDSGDEGTELHLAYETGVLLGLNEEQSQSVTAVLNYTESLKFETAPVVDWEDLKEVGLGLKGLTFGKADRVLLNFKARRAHVVDAKFTRMHSEHNLQLRTYGAAVAEKYPGCFDSIDLHVAAPRLLDISRESFAPEVLLQTVRGFIEELYARIEKPFTPPTACELCAKCANAAECPALSQTALVLARGIGLPVPDTFALDGDASPRDRAIAQILKGAFKNWGEAVGEFNTAYVVAGGEIPGFKLQTRSSGLSVPKDRTADAIAALMSLGLGESAAVGCCRLTVGDAVKALAMVCGATEAEAKERVRTALAGMATEGSSTFLTKVKRVDDVALLKQVTQ